MHSQERGAACRGNDGLRYEQRRPVQRLPAWVWASEQHAMGELDESETCWRQGLWSEGGRSSRRRSVLGRGVFRPLWPERGTGDLLGEPLARSCSDPALAQVEPKSKLTVEPESNSPPWHEHPAGSTGAGAGGCLLNTRLTESSSEEMSERAYNTCPCTIWGVWWTLWLFSSNSHTPDFRLGKDWFHFGLRLSGIGHPRSPWCSDGSIRMNCSLWFRAWGLYRSSLLEYGQGST